MAITILHSIIPKNFNGHKNPVSSDTLKPFQY